ncbi:hypothetical protein BC332_02522 [Capsicum chinense]|nr:hypothetical protein BC332_02522 [Capsicum chinense]
MSINLWLFSPNSEPQGERLNLYLGGATRIAGELVTGVCIHCSDSISLAVLAGTKLIYMCQCGFYLYSIAAFLVWETRRKYLVVMMSHHIVTVILISFSYISRGDTDDQIDNNVERILRVKFITRLFEHSFTDRSLIDLVGCKIKSRKKILVAGTHADDLGYQCGGWTATWTGLSGRITVASVGLAALLVPHGAVLRLVPRLIIEGPAIQPGHWEFNSALKAFGSNIIFSNGLLDRRSSGSVVEDVAETIVALITEKGVQNEERDEENNEDIDLTGEDFWVVDKCFNINSFVLNFLKLIVT